MIDRRTAIAFEIRERTAKARSLLSHWYDLNDDCASFEFVGAAFCVEQTQKALIETAEHIKEEQRIIGRLVIESEILEENEMKMYEVPGARR